MRCVGLLYLLMVLNLGSGKLGDDGRDTLRVNTGSYRCETRFGQLARPTSRPGTLARCMATCYRLWRIYYVELLMHSVPLRFHANQQQTSLSCRKYLSLS